MIKSMTGFGRSEKTTDDFKIAVEIKSVNHRYCDLNIKLPKKFNVFENKIRNTIKKSAERGKIDVFIQFENYSNHDLKVQYRNEIAREYMNAISQARESFGLESGVTAGSLIRFPEVVSLTEESSDIEDLYPVLEDVLEDALSQFVSARQMEGEHLKRDILEKLEYIDSLVDFVEERSPEIIREHREKIQKKVEEFLGDKQIDEVILATELTIYADKVCVDEETVRLRSHIKTMIDTLSKEEAVGRKLDFIAQEMNRESNTILSKANDQELSQCAIDLKTEIEKIREQIQNIE